MDEKLRLVLIFGIGGTVLSIINALTHLMTFGVVQLDTFIDLFIQFPFILYLFYRIYRSIPGKSDSSYGVLSLNIFSYGYGIHLAANAIDEYIAGDTNYKPDLQEDLVAIIYLFDEILGHLVLFIGLFACFYVLTQHEAIFSSERTDLETHEKVLLMILGGGFGSVMGLYLIEATYYIFPGILWSFIWLVRNRDCIVNPRRLYGSMLWWTHLAIPLIALLYFIIFGSLTPPSEIFGF